MEEGESQPLMRELDCEEIEGVTGDDGLVLQELGIESCLS